MTIQMAETRTPPRRLGRSAAAVLLGFVAVVALYPAKAGLEARVAP